MLKTLWEGLCGSLQVFLCLKEKGTYIKMWSVITKAVSLNYKWFTNEIKSDGSVFVCTDSPGSSNMLRYNKLDGKALYDLF